jgi:hypothetical protein
VCLKEMHELVLNKVNKKINAQCLFFTEMYYISPTCFSDMCTIIRENHYAIYLKPDIVIRLLNIVSLAVTL